MNCACGCPFDHHDAYGCCCGCAWGRCDGRDLVMPKPPCRHDVTALLQQEYGLTEAEATVWLGTKITALGNQRPITLIRKFKGDVVVDLIESTRSGFCV